jgi:antitoxin FitA
MASTITIRNVPDALHRLLKARAARNGVSLSDYLLRELQALAARPTIEEMRLRLTRRSAVSPAVSPAEAVRAVRDSGSRA